MHVELLRHWNSDSLQFEAGVAMRQSCIRIAGKRRRRGEEEEERGRGSMVRVGVVGAT